MAALTLRSSLAGIHQGESCWIVGRGPSLLTTNQSEFGPGPVIALNHAIRHVRKLYLPAQGNPLYSLQQDGCLVRPRPPETVILSAAYSVNCFKDYPQRLVLDLERDLSLPPSMSTLIAVKLALLMGCTELNMIAHDAYTTGDDRVVIGSELADASVSFPGYVQGAELAEAAAYDAGVGIYWL